MSPKVQPVAPAPRADRELIVLILRSVVFNLLFYLNLLAHVIAAIPTYALPRRAFMAIARSWGRTTNWLLGAVTNTKVEYRGAEKIQPGALLVASKHQSVWETAALLLLFDDPAYVFKRELMWIPIFGWYAWKTDMIPIDRNARGGALAGMIVRVRDELAHGRQIIIFPEGTRTVPGVSPAYKQGVTRLYQAANVRCLPIALNSGLFWPRRSLRRYPGTVRVEVLDLIPPGLGKEAFFERLQRAVEAATARLVAIGRRDRAGNATADTSLAPLS
jgi:1-acyl-sn-glycerol-3-phosphate acyltransferase